MANTTGIEAAVAPPVEEAMLFITALLRATGRHSSVVCWR